MNSFDIMDGQVYINKELFNNAQSSDAHIVQLIGSNNQHLFTNLPDIHTGIESITIDYCNSDTISIQGDPEDFVNELNQLYHNKFRGCITINDHKDIYDLTINRY